MTKESIILLQLIDCNCNDCKHMVRDSEKYKYWLEQRRIEQLSNFTKEKEKSIADAKQNIIEAKNDNDRKACEGLLRVANKLQFQFSKEGAISYGHCTKFDKSVSFIPAVCQLDTQECFEHRRN